MSLPPTEAFVRLRLLNGGSGNARTKIFHKDVGEGEAFRLYNWAFLIYEPQSHRHVLWDVGQSSDKADYIPSIGKLIDTLGVLGPGKSLGEQLQAHGTQPTDVNTVIFSHAHFDHCRPIAKTFPNAMGYFGPGTADECMGKLEPYNTDPKIGHKFDPRIFDRKISKEKWEELQGPWVRFGPFDKAMDFFGNGSLWVIQGPGHMVGNLCAAARLEDGHWVLLGSDCSHTMALVEGKHEIAELIRPDGSRFCVHEDLDQAKETMRKIRELKQQHGFHIALAHDATWMKAKERDQVLFSLLDEQTLKDVDAHVLFDEPF
ncbi:beta-lactamase-like protein [Exophiala viscosa]|uniref:Beta-lactamase-like protein n=1 Tax=Exophiala viscosa TaxID=2486360 RepID=A0AAN6E501_9EURO|nr:beta-lactamase-like protein [Exophiala viscosa]KAI1627306.1 beta-lactamase-like protein [Exophiala viscosa]